MINKDGDDPKSWQAYHNIAMHKKRIRCRKIYNMHCVALHDDIIVGAALILPTAFKG